MKNPLLIPLFCLSLLLPGCGPKSPPQAPEAVGDAECEAEAREKGLADASWMGGRPGDGSAARAYDEVQQLFTKVEHQQEFRAIAKLAFYEETAPALVTVFERGNARQLRAAFFGLRALIDGIAYLGYVDHDFDREAAVKRIAPILARQENLSKIEGSLRCLPEASRPMFAPLVEKIRARGR